MHDDEIMRTACAISGCLEALQRPYAESSQGAVHLDTLTQFTSHAALLRNACTSVYAQHQFQVQGCLGVLLAFLEWERLAGEGGSVWNL